MTRRTPNLLLIAALIAGISFYISYWVALPPIVDVIWKGSGVTLLALWAFSARRPWIGTVLALGALGDVLLETHGLIPGAIAFATAHLLGTGFYWRHVSRRVRRTAKAVITPAIVTVLVAAASYGITHDWKATGYGGVLGIMAGVAMVSRFPTAAFGTLIFIASDLFLFAAIADPSRTGFSAMVWPTYFAAQALIAWGVVRSTVR